MKRTRVKAVGLGLALLAGNIQAQDERWADAPAPAALPAEVRGSEWTSAGGDAPAAIWLPARVPTPRQVPTNLVPTSGTTTSPQFAPAVVRATTPRAAVGPRVGVAPPVGGSLPLIPELPDAADPVQPYRPAPSDDIKDWRPVGATPRLNPEPHPEPVPVLATAPHPEPVPGPANVLHPEPVPGPANAPRPDSTPRPYPNPATGPIPPGPIVPGPVPPGPPRLGQDVAPFPRPVVPPPNNLPEPRTADAPKPKPQPIPGIVGPGELPAAPPAMMVPQGATVPGKKGTFGSPPITISRDYPPLTDAHDHGPGGHRDRGRGEPGSKATDRLQFQVEYLLWWVNGGDYPPLATTTVSPGAVPSLAAGNGFLGDPATQVLLAGPFGSEQRQGFRVRGGWWFDDCGKCGIDASYFFLGRTSDSVVFNSPGAPVITRPFVSPNINPQTGAIIGETGEIVAFPNFSTGTLAVETSSYLWGADVNLKHAWCKTSGFQAHGFIGYRFLNLTESLGITEFITALPGNPVDPPGTRVVVQDRFDVRNQFHGGQVGVAAERNWGALSLSGRASVALGVTHQELDISGGQIRTRPGMTPPMTFGGGGLLAAGPNLGSFTRDRFAVAPEGTLNLGVWVTRGMKVYAGYNVLYWSNVIRPGDQIDRVVDVTFVPNPPMGIAPSGQDRPMPTFRQSDLWVQGIQFGAEWRW